MDSRHISETFWTPSKHLRNALQMPSRHPPCRETIHTNTPQIPSGKNKMRVVVLVIFFVVTGGKQSQFLLIRWTCMFGVEFNETTSLAAKGLLANRLQHRSACLIQNGRQSLEICETLGCSMFRMMKRSIHVQGYCGVLVLKCFYDNSFLNYMSTHCIIDNRINW